MPHDEAQGSSMFFNPQVISEQNAIQCNTISGKNLSTVTGALSVVEHGLIERASELTSRIIL